jgi:threonyl-tRNA synthetase
VLPVADRHDAYAREVVAALEAAGLRVEIREASADSLGARIRRSKLLKVPYILVVGDDDVEHRTVGVNARGQDDPERGVPLDDLVTRVGDEVAAKA